MISFYKKSFLLQTEKLNRKQFVRTFLFVEVVDKLGPTIEAMYKPLFDETNTNYS